MQKVHFVTYADSNYRGQQILLSNQAKDSAQFDSVIMLTEQDLKSSSYYEKNKSILDRTDEGIDGRVKPGFFAWKPWVIHEAFQKIDDNDIVMYIDCGDKLKNLQQLRGALLKSMNHIDVLLTKGAFKNSQYTKADCFVYMNAFSPKIIHAIQIEAGILVFKKTEFCKTLIRKWARFCMDARIITSDANVCGQENMPDFVEHRWDQSILSILAEKHDLFQSDLMRNFVDCNAQDNK